jgi:hypothetical protein
VIKRSRSFDLVTIRAFLDRSANVTIHFLHVQHLHPIQVQHGLEPMKYGINPFNAVAGATPSIISIGLPFRRSMANDEKS